MLFVELGILLLCVVLGARLGGIALGTLSGIGLLVFVLGFGMPPGSPPAVVLGMILAVITATLVGVVVGIIAVTFKGRELDDDPEYQQRLAAGGIITLAFKASPADAIRGKLMSGGLVGEKEVPADALYGIQTARAMENFQITGHTLTNYPELINGFARVKMDAAMGNTDVGKMKKPTRYAIVKAGQAILTGKYHDQFQVDPLPPCSKPGTNWANTTSWSRTMTSTCRSPPTIPTPTRSRSPW